MEPIVLAGGEVGILDGQDAASLASVKAASGFATAAGDFEEQADFQAVEARRQIRKLQAVYRLTVQASGLHPVAGLCLKADAHAGVIQWWLRGYCAGT